MGLATASTVIKTYLSVMPLFIYVHVTPLFIYVHITALGIKRHQFISDAK